MIFFFAGAPKHGSHFQLYIITEALKQQGVGYEPAGQKIFDNNDSAAARVLLDKLNQKADDYFICKGHFLDRELLYTYPNLRIFLIWREMGDVLVSRYHYLKKRYGRTFKDFADFYEKDGRKHMFYQRYYQLLWGLEEDARVFHVSYTDLREDFQNAVRPMLAFAGISGVDVARLEDTVSLERSRKKHNDPKGILIRKGAVGEYKSVISPEILADMNNISGMSAIQIKAHAFLNDPKVIVAQYYQYPGKALVNWALKKRKNDLEDKQQEASNKPEVMWWD